MRLPDGHELKFLQAVGLITALCLILFVLRTIVTGQLDFFFIPGNLVLAWLAVGFGWGLVEMLKTHRWISWQALGLTAGWLIFLPNGWYVLTDFTHVYPSGAISELYDIAMVGLLVIGGFSLGYASLYLVHLELIRRLGTAKSWGLMLATILLSSFAIYLGRDLRWNTWDVVTNPGGIIINASDRLVDPLGQPRALNVTLLFFVFISVVYLAIWLMLSPRKSSKSR